MKHKNVTLKDLGMTPAKMKAFAGSSRFIFNPIDAQSPVRYSKKGGNSANNRDTMAGSPPPTDELFHKF